MSLSGTIIAAEDELFLVFKGTLHIDFRGGKTVTLQPGELYVVPRGVAHRPHTPAGTECWIMLLEPITTKHTGEVTHPLTNNTYTQL